MPRVDDVRDLSNFDQHLAELCAAYGVPLIAVAYLRPIVGMTGKYGIVSRLLVGYEGKEDNEAGQKCTEVVSDALVEYCNSVDLPLCKVGNN